MMANEAIFDEVKISAWLSYRHPSDLAKEKRQQLQQICEQQGIQFSCDVTETHEGDHLIEFMNHLSAARGAFIFLTPDYFESEYTLYELICFSERGDLENRYIKPVRLSDDMVTKVWGRSKTYWDDHASVRDGLRRLLKQYWEEGDSSDDELWGRIESAWNTLIEPYLDELQESVEASDSKLQSLVVELKKTLSEAIRQSHKKFVDDVVVEVKSLLEYSNPLVRSQLIKRLRVRGDGIEEQIAHQLVEKTIEATIGDLSAITRNIKASMVNQEAGWIGCFDEIKELCGWLLLTTVNPVWWFQQNLRWKRAQKGSTERFFYKLETLDYIEVVVSRSAMRPAFYEYDQEKGKVVAPHFMGDDDGLMFDAVSPDAGSDEFYIELHKKLYGSAPLENLKGDGLREKVASWARGRFYEDEEKLIYYLVREEQYKQLIKNGHFRQVEEALSKYVKFIACLAENRPALQSPCENQQELLQQVAYLLSIKE